MPKKKIGNGWYQAVDPTSNRPYYIHKEKRLTQWARPTDEELGLVEPSSSNEAAVAPPASPKKSTDQSRGKWQKRIDKRSGKTYYVNKATRQSQWEKPEGFVDEEAAATTAAAAKKPKKKSRSFKHGIWQVRKDKKGRVYYANTETMKTQWEKPPELEGVTITFPDEEDEQETQTDAEATVAEVSETEAEELEEKDTVAPLKTRRKTPAPIRTTDSYFNMSSIDQEPEPQTASASASGSKSSQPSSGAKSTPAIPEASGGSKDNSQFEDLGAYILKQTGTVTVNAIDNKRTNRGWGDNVTMDLRDIVDVHIDDATLQQDMADYAATKFHTKYQGANALAFEGKPLTVPLLAKLKSAALVKSAVQMSKNITGFVGTRKTSKAGFSHAEKIFVFVLEDICDETNHDNIPLLWDEIYCQVVKVSVLQPDVDIAISTKAWQLFAVLASVFPCSKTLFPYLVSWCEKIKSSAPKNIYALAWYTQKALRRGQDLPFRKLVPPVLPTDMEISSILDSEECCIRIFTINGHSRVLPVTSWTTASEVCRIMARSLGIRDRKCFRIYVTDSVSGHRVLDEEARILDVVAQLQFDASQNKGAELERVRQGHMSSVFLFKAEFYGRVNPGDPEALAYLFEQSINDVIQSTCLVPLSAAVDLAAIQAYEESLRKGERVTDIRLDVMLFKYLPPRLLQKVASSQRPGVAAAVLRRAKTLEAKRYSLVAAHVAYLEYIAKMPWYGAEHFIVEAVKIYHGIPAKFQLSITPSWVLIVDIESRRILHVLDWTMLRNYGGKERFLKFKVKAEGMEEIMFFHTEEDEDVRILKLLDVYKLRKL